jgi:hypothetical protein
VGVVEAGRHLGRDVRRDERVEAQAAIARARHGGGEIGPFDILHGEKQPLGIASDVEHGHDVLVRKLGRDARLAQEQLCQPRIGEELLAHALDHKTLGDAGGAAAPGQEHLGHPATPDGSHELVAADRTWHGTSIGRLSTLAR